MLSLCRMLEVLFQFLLRLFFGPLMIFRGYFYDGCTASDNLLRSSALECCSRPSRFASTPKRGCPCVSAPLVCLQSLVEYHGGIRESQRGSIGRDASKRGCACVHFTPDVPAEYCSFLRRQSRQPPAESARITQLQQQQL